MGEPVSYSGNDTDIEILKAVFNENDEQDINSQLAKDCSIYGVAYELAYLDENAQIKLTKSSPLNSIPIYDDTVNSNLLYFIRFNEVKNILDDTTITFVTLYSSTSVREYKRIDTFALEPLEDRLHNFNIVPVSIYKNNDDMLGDYELVIDLIDYYDRLESDTANAFDYYNDCYLVFTGATIDDEDAQAMKEKRLLQVPRLHGTVFN